jgi:integrase
MNAKITLRKDKQNTNGLCPVVIQVYNKKDVGRIPLGFSLKAEDFDFGKEVVLKRNSNSKSYNEIIVSAKRKIGFSLDEVKRLQNSTYQLPLIAAFKDLYESAEKDVDEIKDKYNKDFGLAGEVIETGLDIVQREARIPLNMKIPASRYAEAIKLLNLLVRGELDPKVECALAKEENDNQEQMQYFKEVWDKYYKYCQREKAPATVTRIPNNLAILEAYSEYSHTPLMFESFTEDFGSELKFYLLNEHYNYVTKSKGISNGTVHNVLKSISTFLNWAFKKGLNPSVEFKKWEVRKPKSDLQYLTEPQLKQLFEYKLETGSSFDKTRDLWLFSAFSGMRWGDIEKWVPSNVTSQGLIKYRSEKVKKDCTVGLNEVTKTILKKYDGQLPRQNDVLANKNIKEILAKIGFNKIIVNRVIAKGTQNIVRQMPLSESITLHSARRSFINLMISKGRSIAHLSTMVGNDLKSLSIYYKDDTSQMKRIMDEVKFFKK